ncbi:MAG TPA: hypothetical protein VI011_01730 [Asanoa sp.]
MSSVSAARSRTGSLVESVSLAGLVSVIAGSLTVAVLTSVAPVEAGSSTVAVMSIVAESPLSS